MTSSDDRVTRVERQLAAAQQITHIGSWEWDVRTDVVAWSDELYRIYGFEPQSREITFDFFLSRLHPDDSERVKLEVGRALERGGRFAYRERVLRPDGTVREVDTVGEVVRDAEGRPAGVLGTCRDVTEERRRDEAIGMCSDLIENIQIGLVACEVGNPDDARSIRVVSFNPAAEAIVGVPLAAAVGKSPREILPRAAGGPLEEIICAVAREGRVREAVARTRDPVRPTRALALKAFPLYGQRVGVSIEDVTEPTRTRQLLEREHHVLEKIAAGAELTEILTAIVRAIEDHSPASIGSILLLDADGEGARVRHGAAPSLPPSYVEALDGAPIGPRAGSCGTAAYTRQPVYVEDIETDARWADYCELALAHGLRACWSTPMIATDGRVLGAVAFYYRERRAPSEADRALMHRVTHLAGIAVERRQIEDQLRALSAHAESVREEERTGIAREIHDELGQALTALKMDLAWLSRRISGESTVSEMTLLEKIGAMSAMTDEVIQQVRRISSELRPGVLDDLGLLAAVEWQGEELEKRTGTTCRIVSNVPDDLSLDRELSVAVFRIFQEALTNVARHARATQVDVHLEAGAETLRLEVRDDGVGILPDAARSPKSLGLLGMRERARRLGGAALVTGMPGQGTTVVVEVPIGERRGEAR